MSKGLLRESGFSFVELLTVIALLSILSFLVIPNYQSFKKRAFETTAEADMRNAKLGILAQTNDPDRPVYFIMTNFLGPGPLPYPLTGVTLSNNVRMTIAAHLQFFGGSELTFIQLGHEGGDNWYRYIEFNGQRIEQIIPK